MSAKWTRTAFESAIGPNKTRYHRAMKSIAAFCLSLVAFAQTANVTAGGKVQQFSVPAAPITVVSLFCNLPGSPITQPAGTVITIMPGESSHCVVSISGQAPAGGFTVTPYTADAPLTLSPVTLVVPAGQVSVTFTVSRP